MAIDLYQIEPSPPCRAVIMAAQHLGIKLNLIRVDLLAEEHLKPEFLKINPEHTVPTIDDGGFILWESRAIMKYLVNKYVPDSSLYPKDPQQRATVDRMLYFDLGLFNGFAEIFRHRFRDGGKEVGAEKYEAFHRSLQSLEDALTKSTYSAGNRVTLADYSVLPTLTMAPLIDVALEKYPKIVAFMKRLKEEIPSYKEINEDPVQWVKGIIESKK